MKRRVGFSRDIFLEWGYQEVARPGIPASIYPEVLAPLAACAFVMLYPEAPKPKRKCSKSGDSSNGNEDASRINATGDELCWNCRHDAIGQDKVKY
jgi:hypothetical protein